MSDDDTETEADPDDLMVAAWQARLGGKSFRHIAEMFGVSVSTAHAWVRRCSVAELGPPDAPDVAALRALEVQRHDRWQSIAESRLAEPDAVPETVLPVLLRISAARRALLGLDSPTRVAVSDDRAGRVGPDPELAAKVRDARERAEAERQAIDREYGPAGRPAQRGPTGVVR